MAEPRLGLRAASPVLALALILALPVPAAARDHHVAAGDSADSAGAPDGSPAAPWPSVAAALAGGAGAGDRLLLAPGSHGHLEIAGQRFAPALTIASAPAGRAHLDRVVITDSAGLVLRDLDIWPRTPGRTRGPRGLVRAGAGAQDIRFAGLDVRGGPDAPAYRRWTREDWVTRWRHDGVQLRGPDQVLVDSTITGVRLGVGAAGARVRVAGNEIRGFSGDGIRVFGAGSVIADNTVRDCVKVDDNHDDGLQSWAGIGQAPPEVVDITVSGNRILEWTGPADHPLRCALHGIGLFDGPYRGWQITNNLIVVRAWHGITLNGMTGAVVANNTLVHADGLPQPKPWIRQDGPSRAGGNRFANNIAGAFHLGSAARAARDNLVLRHPWAEFEDPAAFDFRPKPGSRLLDAAAPGTAPDRDLRGVARPQGAGPDLGAYERCAAPCPAGTALAP